MGKLTIAEMNEIEGYQKQMSNQQKTSWKSLEDSLCRLQLTLKQRGLSA